MTRRLTPLLLLLLALCLPAMGHASESPFASGDGLRDLGEPTIRLTTSGAVGANYSFTIIGGATPIQIDWGDGTLVSPTSTMVRGKKVGDEIKIYGDCLSFLATGAKITAITIDAPAMGMLSLADNELTTLDLSKTPAIESLNLQNNKLTSLDLHGLVSITTLNVKLNNLESLNLSGLNKLKRLIASDNPALTSLEASTLTSLSSVRAENCALEQVSLPASITEFYAKGNKLTKLGEGAVSFPKLLRLRLPNNQITEFTVGECPLLNDLELDGNKLTSLTLGSLPALKTLYLQKNLLSADALNKVYNALPSVSGTIKVAENPGAEKAYGYIATDKGWKIDVLGQKNDLGEPTIRLTTSTEIGADCSFRIMGDAIQIDWGDGTLTPGPSTSPNVKGKKAGEEIKVYGNCTVLLAPGANITSISINSEQLGMLSLENNELTTLDHINAPNLGILKVQNNKLTSFQQKELKSLSTVDLRRNDLESIDLRGLEKLKNLDVSYNARLSAIDGSAMPSLTSIKADSCALEQVALPAQIAEFYAKGNKLTKLGEGAVAFPKLLRLRLQGNDFAELTFGECPLLNDLELEGNKLTALTLGALPALKTLLLQENLLEAEALNKIYKDLPTIAGTIKVVGNPGAEQAYGYIAKDKGWEIDILGQENKLGEPTIRLTTSTEIGADCSFRIMGDAIQIDWGDGTLTPGPSTSPNVKGKKAGEEIKVYGNCTVLLAPGANITSISINSEQLGMLSLENNELTTLDHINAPNLGILKVQNNKLTSFQQKELKSLSTVDLRRNDLESIDLRGLEKLKNLDVSYNARLSVIDGSIMPSLTSIKADSCALEQIALPEQIAEFYAKGNKLSKLSEGAVSFSKLQRLRLQGNDFAELTFGECPVLNELDLDGNKLTALTLGTLPGLRKLFLQGNLLEADALNKVYNALPTLSGTIKVADNPGAEKAQGYIATDKGWEIDVPGQKSQDPEPVITIKTKSDVEFSLGLSGFADESKVQIETDEGVVVEKTITSGVPPIEKYKSTRGLIRIIGLVHTIDCSENGSITYDIDASQSPKLVKFYALHNTMTSVNVKGCADLTFINCAGSELPEIDLSDCKQLETVWLPGNKMISIDLTGLTNLQELSLERNLLTDIRGLSDCTKLTELNVAENELTTLALTGLSSLNKLDCRDNKLTALDLSSCTALTEAFCYKNAIKEPAMKKLFESLPARNSSERGELYAIDSSEQSEENEVNDADVKIATDKSWLVYDYKNYDNSGKNPLANDPVVSADHYRLMITGDYIEIAQATPHAVVELYTLDGTLLQSARADLSGELRLSIAELPTGSYLLSVDGEATKVIL